MAEPPKPKRLKETVENLGEMEILPVESLDRFYQYVNLQSDEFVGMRRMNKRQPMITITKTGISKRCRICSKEPVFDSIRERQEHERGEHVKLHIRLNRKSPRCCLSGCPEYTHARGVTKVDKNTCRKWLMSHIREKHEVPRDIFACKLADRDTPDQPCMSLQFTLDHARRHLRKVHKIPHGNLTDEVLASSFRRVIPEELVHRAVHKEKTAEIHNPVKSKWSKRGNHLRGDDGEQGQESMDQKEKETCDSEDESNTLFGWRLPADPTAHFRIPPFEA